MKLSLDYEKVLLHKMDELRERILKTCMDETDEKEGDLEDSTEFKICRLSYVIWDDEINGFVQTTDDEDQESEDPSDEKSVGDSNDLSKNENVVDCFEAKDSLDETSRISGKDVNDFASEGNEDGSSSSS